MIASLRRCFHQLVVEPAGTGPVDRPQERRHPLSRIWSKVSSPAVKREYSRSDTWCQARWAAATRSPSAVPGPSGAKVRLIAAQGGDDDLGQRGAGRPGEIDEGVVDVEQDRPDPRVRHRPAAPPGPPQPGGAQVPAEQLHRLVQRRRDRPAGHGDPDRPEGDPRLEPEGVDQARLQLVLQGGGGELVDGVDGRDRLVQHGAGVGLEDLGGGGLVDGEGIAGEQEAGHRGRLGQQCGPFLDQRGHRGDLLQLRGASARAGGHRDPAGSRPAGGRNRPARAGGCARR